MKNNVENDLANQAPAPMEPVFTESNIQPTVVPEQPQQMVTAPTVGTPAPKKTNAFVEKLLALKTKLLSHGAGPVIAIAAVVIIAIVLVFGVAGASPKQVFKSTINKTFKEVEKAIDEYDEYSKKYDIRENAILVDLGMTMDSNIKELTDQLGFELKDLSVGAEVGFDLKNEVLHVETELKGEKEKLDATMQVIDDKLYLSSSLLDKVVVVEEELGLDFGELKDAIKEVEKEISTDPEDYKYVVKTIRKALVKALNSEYMEKEKVELDLGDDSFKATKYSYIFEEDSVQELVEIVCEYLLEDDDFVKVLSDITGMEKSDIKSTLKEAKKSADEIEFEEEVVFNLYTKGLFNKAIGFSVEFEGKEYVTYIIDGKNAEFIMDNHMDDEYSQMKLVVTIEEDGKEQALTIKYNGEKIATGTIKELSEEVIDMSVKMEYEETEAKLDLYLSAKEEKEKVSGKYDVKLEVDGEYIALKGNYGIAVPKKLTKISTKGAISVDEVDVEKLEKDILAKVEKDSVFKGVYDLAMETYEEEYLDLNYDGMLEISSNEVANVLSKTKATVLYVGEDYYSMYSEVDAYNMFENLLQAQEDLDFYSHYLDTYYLNTAEFEALVKDVQYTCKTTPNATDNATDAAVATPVTCQNYPAIYLIKDGKVQKAFRGTVTLEELKTALKDLGM